MTVQVSPGIPQKTLAQACETIARLSHDTQGQLAAIKGLIELNLDGFRGELNGNQAKDLRSVWTIAIQLAETFKDLSLYTKLKDEPQRGSRDEIKTKDWIRGISAKVRSIESQLGVSFCVVDEGPLSFFSDELVLTHCVLNLIKLGLFSSKKEDKVTLYIGEDHEKIKISVTDNGDPIVDLESIYTPFEGVSRRGRLSYSAFLLPLCDMAGKAGNWHFSIVPRATGLTSIFTLD